ncbi:hypothetical protein NP233_g10484 [Leucocoprinus birnbaumii]|uniref:Uncharacterized protein n=1 Tax=Leucocoprinus birnbaumii TaxID=56174 RepID=A0AAD5VP73_9AGAR|nr:hypothetical protein NP233_g10484 [Leucocoprinus birnbaumii]
MFLRRIPIRGPLDADLVAAANSLFNDILSNTQNMNTNQQRNLLQQRIEQVLADLNVLPAQTQHEIKTFRLTWQKFIERELALYTMYPTLGLLAPLVIVTAIPMWRTSKGIWICFCLVLTTALLLVVIYAIAYTGLQSVRSTQDVIWHAKQKSKDLDIFLFNSVVRGPYALMLLIFGEVAVEWAMAIVLIDLPFAFRVFLAIFPSIVLLGFIVASLLSL